MIDPTPSEAPRRRTSWRRRLGRLFAVLALVAASLAWAAIDRDLSAPDRVRLFAERGVPATPSAFVRVRAAVQGPPRVGIQIGHLDAHDQPDELSALRVSTGAEAGGWTEVGVNQAVAEALAARLQAAGIEVDLLPARVPPGYRADLLLSVHADASPDPDRRGYKSAHAVPARNDREPLLKATVDAAYVRASALPDDDANVTGAMLDYYAFAHQRLHHAAARSTPGLIVELGYLSHPADRAWLADPEAPAGALADGLLRYFAALDRWHPDLAFDRP